MSQAAELKKNEYESANGSPEKKIGDTEVIKDEVEGEGEESDDYETDSEVCVHGNITKIWEFNPFWQEEKHIAEDEEDEGEGEGVCICAQPVFLCTTPTHIIDRNNKTSSPTSLL